MPESAPKQSLGALVRHYRRVYAPRRRQDLRCYRQLPDWKTAIVYASGAQSVDGKVPSHQRRIGRVCLRRFANALLAHARQLKRCRGFASLHEAVVECKIDGVGELAIYDAAVRLGAYLGLEPRQVYLHAGARAGVAALGLPTRPGVIDRSDLPRPLRRLNCDELEDFFCIYKHRLRNLRETTGK